MRVLVVSQYPIHPALHGGQKRTSEIVTYYQRRNQVRHAAIYWPHTYDAQPLDYSENLIIDNPTLVDALSRNPERADLLLSDSLGSRHSSMRGSFEDIIASYQPDIIHIEQPYLVSSVRAVLDNLNVRPLVVHGSQNVEHLLKESVYKNTLPQNDVRYLVQATKIIEKAAIDHADINVGVSRADIKTLRQLSGTSSVRWLQAGNGTRPATRHSGPSPLSTIIFIGSAHPPNYLGVELLLSDTSYLNDETPLLLIGGVGDYFLQTYDKDDVFWQGKRVVGKISEAELDAYIQQASIIVLPITTGGGSNLKTAEAIYTQKKIVGTDFAFRGFEKYKSLPNISIANTPTAFKEAILATISSDTKLYTPHQKRIIQHLEWRYTLRRLRIVMVYAGLLSLLKVGQKYLWRNIIS